MSDRFQALREHLAKHGYKEQAFFSTAGIRDLLLALDEARATACTTNIDEELDRLSTQIAVAFHFVIEGNSHNYELEEARKSCKEAAFNSFIRLALPYKNQAEKAEAENEKLREALEKIEQWSRAYPLSVFPEPDFAKAAQLLKEGGMTLDAISSSNIRYTLDGVAKITRDALKGETANE